MPPLPLVLRFRTILLWVVITFFLILIVQTILREPQNPWNDARIAPVAAWLRGFPLYTPASFGIINGNIYPPLGALAFAPAAILDHPVVAVVVGSMLAFAMTMSAGITAASFCSRELHDWPQGAVLGTVVYAGLLLLDNGADSVMFSIHSDAPAISLSLWGTIFYARWWAAHRPSSLVISAFLLASGVMAKQLVVVLPAIFFFLTVIIGRTRPALIFAGTIVCSLCFWLLALTPVVKDWHTVFYNCLIIPSNHPLRGDSTPGISFDRLVNFINEGAHFLKNYWTIYLIAFASVLTLWINGKRPDRRSLLFPFTLSASCLIAGLANLPLSVLAFMKVGGAWNNLAYTIVPILLALAISSLGLLDIARRAGDEWNVMAQLVLCGGLLIFIFVLRPGLLHNPFNIASAPMLTAYEESKSGNVWFPEFPLSSLLATGHSYHFSYGIFDRYLAGKPVLKEQILEGVPTPPFKIKYLIESHCSRADMVPQFLGLSGDIISQRNQKGPWMEVMVPELLPPKGKVGPFLVSDFCNDDWERWQFQPQQSGHASWQPEPVPTTIPYP
jgi:hypothetical protein